MQGNWENWRNSFWWSANREFFLSENDFKRSSEIQKFSRENVDIFWWSANRDKFCKVVRESEKVENRCPRVSYILCSVSYTLTIFNRFKTMQRFCHGLPGHISHRITRSIFSKPFVLGVYLLIFLYIGFMLYLKKIDI